MKQLKLTVLDMQPIDPPTGGGRLRLLGLYSGFKNGIQATYVGTYDWRGPDFRDHALSSCLREITVPLSEEHFLAHDELSAKIGKGCIDVAFPTQGWLSKDYVSRTQEETKKADIVIVSHPWVFPFVIPAVDKKRQLLVYDSHNMEAMLRINLLDDGTEEVDKLLREAVRTEYELCHVADAILVCSQEDKDKYSRFFHVPADKMYIVPNGVFSTQIKPCENAEHKKMLRKKLGLHSPTACFIGSAYYPNEEAARLVIEMAQDMPNYQFVIIGGVGNSLEDIDLSKHKNVIITGFVDEQEKIDYLQASDIAINPMLSGSGTNIKMFDFMAAGLPIVTTEIGARGIKNTGGNIFDICETNKNDLASKIVHLFSNKNRIKILRNRGRIEVCEKYSWEQISYELGYLLTQQYKKNIEKVNPYFSVIIPSYERHSSLIKLLMNLQKQTFQDFEVIIVDQSSVPFQSLEQFETMDITYFLTSVKGAAKARNTGIRLAKGHIVAFIDDDCIPEITWLGNAKKYLETFNTVGVEGLIEADIYDKKTHRVVTNVGFEGIGFMTANLFVRLAVLRQIDGFDENLDNPHFREDTDLAWRALEYGNIPYAKDVIVLHPSHKRDGGREDFETRSSFYTHDPLLLKKHPSRFADLFVFERHYINDKNYWEYFKKGIERHNVPRDLLHQLFSDKRVELDHVPEDVLSLYL